jgi:hypothetical protein
MKFAKRLLFPVLALMLSGCAGYRVGSTLDPSIKTVSLSVVNKIDEPSIEVAVEKALRAELQMDGRLEVRPQAEADAVLTVTLTRFDLNALAYNRRQDSLAAEYRMMLYGSAVLTRVGTDEVILENPKLHGEVEFPYVADLTSSKRSGLSGAAHDLARKVVSTLVTAW